MQVIRMDNDFVCAIKCRVLSLSCIVQQPPLPLVRIAVICENGRSNDISSTALSECEGGCMRAHVASLVLHLTRLDIEFGPSTKTVKD
jgi:hypothetical protein